MEEEGQREELRHTFRSSGLQSPAAQRAPPTSRQYQVDLSPAVAAKSLAEEGDGDNSSSDQDRSSM